MKLFLHLPESLSRGRGGLLPVSMLEGELRGSTFAKGVCDDTVSAVDAGGPFLGLQLTLC